MRYWLSGALVATAAMGGAAAAQDVALLESEFDARALTDPETRLLQVGLTAAGEYDDLIDGKWGPASQRGLQGFIRAAGLADADGRVHGYHLAVLGAEAEEFVARHSLGYRGGTTERLHMLLSPPGAFDEDPETVEDDYVLTSGAIEIRTFESDVDRAVALHQEIEGHIAPAHVPYIVRNAGRWVTSITAGDRLFHLRTDYAPDAGAYFTTVVTAQDGADRALYRVIVGGIAVGAFAELGTPGGALARVVAEVRALAATPPVVPSTAPPAAQPEAPPGDGAGTAFFVNNNDLVTAGHVVDGCREVALADATPLTVVARHPRLDLALLSSPKRSRAWIAVGATGEARLGQRIFVLGYPFFSTLGTALNMTGGNVSALVGIGDDPDSLTISAPVQPGNSGGPLMARDGTVIGVVVARLDALKVAEATGSLPENVNYAVTGRALLAFLDTEGVSLPRAKGAVADFDDGIPEAMQQAVVPVICRGA